MGRCSLNEADSSGEARHWLGYAAEDLAAARALAASGQGAPRQPCWLAQQAAEKAIKALLIHARLDFPRSHDLDMLWNLVPAPLRARRHPPDLAELTEGAVEARCPGDWPEATSSDAARAIAATEQVVGIVREERSAEV